MVQPLGWIFPKFSATVVVKLYIRLKYDLNMQKWSDLLCQIAEFCRAKNLCAAGGGQKVLCFCLFVFCPSLF